MNRQALYQRLHRHMSHRGHISQVWVTLDVPASIPRWSPGPEWVEAASGNYWLRPRADGQHEVMVLTYDRDEISAYGAEEFEALALVRAVITEDRWFGTFVDKPHRIYSTGFVKQPLTITTIEHDHPAVLYRQAWDDERNDFWHRSDRLQPPGGAHSLWLRPDVQIKPDGSGWYLMLHATLGGFLTPNEEYWADVNDLAITVKRLARFYSPTRIHVQRSGQDHFTDPLWQPAMAAITRTEEN